MFQIDNDTASQNLAAPTSAGVPGYFTDGDPAKGLAATVLPAEFMNMLMMEFINLVKTAGLTPSKSDYTQLSKAVPALISKLATVDWSKVTNIPTDLLRANTAATLQNLELISASPYIDFHYGSDTADYNMRLANNVDGMLSVLSKAGSVLLSINSNALVVQPPLYSKQQIYIYSQGFGPALGYLSTDGTLRYCTSHDATAFRTFCYADDGTAITVSNVDRATGTMAFGKRPSFAGAIPWDSANFNPATKANAATTLGGYGITDAVGNATYVATINSLNGQIAALNNGLGTKQNNLGYTPARQGGGAYQQNNTVYLGWDGAGCRIQIDSTDLGKVLTETNYAAYMPAGMASVGVYGVGSYVLATLATGAAANPGNSVAGGNLRAAPTAGTISGGGLPGTWVCCGLSFGNGNTNSTTLWQRIS